jgi:hypothetical protein
VYDADEEEMATRDKNGGLEIEWSGRRPPWRRTSVGIAHSVGPWQSHTPSRRLRS